MDKVEERKSKILELLSVSGKLEVTTIAAQCKVSLVTVRKDLTELEQCGMLRREQGYAILNDGSDMRRRLAANHAVKRRLARTAAMLVDDGDTVMIESGSCCILLAEEISRTKENVTIVTNSIFIAQHIGKSPRIHVVLLGGDYQADSQAVVGPITRVGAQSFHVRYLFAGTDGYRPGTGFTGDNHLRVEALRNMAESADQVVILTESQKFWKQGVVPLFSLQQIGCLVTDEAISHEVQKELERHSIRVCIAALT